MKLTIFTPTYNRAHTIEKLYESLKRQTCFDFEWLVVDDGSKDNTAQLFSLWEKEEKPFTIRYIRQENGGKHRAVNKGVTLAEGELFFIVDSDDFLTRDAVETVFKWRSLLPENENFAGFAGAKGYSEEKMIGTGHGAGEFIDCKNGDRQKYGLLSDKAEVYFTEILRQFPFPEFEGENFITESVVWNAISLAGYKMRWYDRIIYVAEYRPDGLTADNMGLFFRNPRGHLLALKTDLLTYDPPLPRRLAILGMYYKVGKKLCKTEKEMAGELGVSRLELKFCGLIRAFIDTVRAKKG